MNELTTSHQLFLGKDYSRRNTQEQLMEDEDGNNAWPLPVSTCSLTMVLSMEFYQRLQVTPSRWYSIVGTVVRAII